MSFAVTGGALTAAAAATAIGTSVAGAVGGGSSYPNSSVAQQGAFQKISYNPVSYQNIPQVSYDPNQGANDLLSIFPQLQQFANQSTANQTQQRESIMPGSSQLMSQASSALSSFLSGQVPQDVVDQTNRIVAERNGGAYNPNARGTTMAQNDFARSIGQTSTNLVSQGLSAAPTWLQLANSFVIGVPQAYQMASDAANNRYKYDVLSSNINQFNAQQANQINQFNAQNQLGVDQFNSTQGTNAAATNYQGQANSALFNAQQQNQQLAQGNSLASLLANSGQALWKNAENYQSNVRTPSQFYNNGTWNTNYGQVGNSLMSLLNSNYRF